MAKEGHFRRQLLKNKIAVVCGGSKGIDKETAREVVLLGGSVYIIAREAGPLEDTLERVEGFNTARFPVC